MNQDKETHIPSQDEMAYERTELSGYRTDLAYERTALANSQTILSYFRTAIATFAAGIGMFEFVNNQEIITIGVILMLISPVIALIGIIHFFRVRGRIKR